MIELYKYWDRYGVRREGIIFCSILQKGHKVTSKCYFWNKEETQRNLHIVFHNWSQGAVDAKKLHRCRDGLDKLMEENSILWSGKSRATYCLIMILRKIVLLYILVFPFCSSVGNWCWWKRQSSVLYMAHPAHPATPACFVSLLSGFRSWLISDLSCSSQILCDYVKMQSEMTYPRNSSSPTT